ncbi:MAG: hypothetical protein NTX43_07030 [Bacteroidetes bacterium]|nr:hypothetical protein [Bacteroidota bacterium]
MKTTFRKILPLGLLLVFAVYGYSQNSSTAAVSKQTQTTQSTASCGKFVDKNADGICDNHKNNVQCKGNGTCCGKGRQHCQGTCQGKQMPDCKKSCSGSHDKAGCGTAGAGCGKGNPNPGNCPNKGNSGQAAPEKTTTPAK